MGSALLVAEVLRFATSHFATACQGAVVSKKFCG